MKNEITTSEPFYLSLPTELHVNNSIVKPEFALFQKKKKPKKINKPKPFHATKWPKIIAGLEVLYLVLGYLTDQIWYDDYLVIASMLIGGSVLMLEKKGKIEFPDAYFFKITNDEIQYIFNSGLGNNSEGIVKLLRIAGFMKPKKIAFKDLKSVEIQFRSLKFKLKNNKVKIVDIFTFDENIALIHNAVYDACMAREIPITVSSLAQGLLDKFKDEVVEEN